MDWLRSLQGKGGSDAAQKRGNSILEADDEVESDKAGVLPRRYREMTNSGDDLTPLVDSISEADQPQSVGDLQVYTMPKKRCTYRTRIFHIVFSITKCLIVRYAHCSFVFVPRAPG